MPRIDPIQLLNCLGILLSSNGGIKSRDEVQRLASLMTKFSKKLVSKCIYIQILKSTGTELLGQFMGSGGWRLVHMWLTESIVAKNWPLVQELLELLLLCPVDIERLKTNNCPKLVKELSKDGNLIAIRALASKLVEQWLRTVKGEPVSPIQIKDIPQIILEASQEIQNETNVEANDGSKNVIEDQKNNKFEVEDSIRSDENRLTSKENDNACPETLPVLKISIKDGKQIISQIDESSGKLDNSKTKHKSKNKDKNKGPSDITSKSKSSKYDKNHSSSDKIKSSSSISTHLETKKEKTHEKDKNTSSKEKNKSKKESKSCSSSKSSSSTKRDETKNKSSSKRESDKRKDNSKVVIKEEKNKITQKNSSEVKEEPISISKLGKIPKISDSKKSKPSISIEVRKPDEPKPKTVKTFNSKFRKHGLEEEIKPPPSRASILNKKTSPVLAPIGALSSKPSPVNEFPPEKKAKIIETVEKPGAIKLIPAKPKPMMLLESDMFMDALNASATNKKEPKKRKRRTSVSKDGNSSFEGSPPHTSVSPRSSNESKSVPARFYKDTMEVEEDKEKQPDNIENNEGENEDDIIRKENSTCTVTINGLKGVLLYNRKKGPKKSIKWKPDAELEEIQYFELDETERVNVTKTFTDMKYLERIHEREAFQKARNLINDDLMEEKTNWKPLILIDTQGQTQVDYGKNSKEKEIQASRQKGTLQPLYFHKSMIPDSPLEPDLETHTYSEPTNIPLEDVTGNQDNISDFRNMPWPEPKGNAPPASSANVNVLFPPNLAQFPNSIPPNQFPGLPGFQGHNVMPSDWPKGMPPMINNTLPGPILPGLPPGPIMPGSLPPGMIIPPEGMMMSPEMFGAPNPMFGMPPEGFNMPPNMFPPDFNMPMPQGPPCPDGFQMQGNFRGAMRGRGSSNHWRGKSSGNWDTSHRGRPGQSRGGRKTVCIYFQRKGACRMGDNCAFLHPGVNGPF